MSEPASATAVGDGRPAPACSLRERHKQQTWNAIHLAAADFIAERGLDDVTIREICEEAGVSERTFFNYFASKSAAALGLKGLELGDDPVQAFLTSDGNVVRDACVMVARTVVMPHDRHRAKELVARRPELLPALWEHMNKIREDVAGLVEQRVKDDERAWLITSLVIMSAGAVLKRSTTASRSDLQQALLDAVEQFGQLARMED